jgi:predicted ATPase/transcriptional regulator with XRE-family HTH domain
MSSKPSKNLSDLSENPSRNLAQFYEKVQTYRRLSGNSQKELADALGLHPKVLSRKLSLTNEAVLTLPEIKQIIKTLAEWRSILTQPEALDLLALMGLPASVFSEEEWHSIPLGRLVTADELEEEDTGSFEEPAPEKEARQTDGLDEDQPARPPVLPVFPTSLIGRNQSATQVSSLLQRADVQIVTLLGPGGIGKTRLSVQVASSLLPNFRQGVWFVSLAALRDPSLVLPTIAQTLGLHTGSTVPVEEMLAGYFRNKQMLLVLDNFEQVIEAAPALGRSLTSAAGLKLLITSRIALRLYGEQEYSVPLLPWPDLNGLLTAEHVAENPAVRLFVQRAQAVKADFELTPQNAPAVAAICARLEGLPLAIELAATRIRLFTPEILLARLDNRLTMLTGGSRDLPERQKTVRATIQWSYDLLDEAEKTLFAYLGVFAGGATLPAVEAVCSSELFSAETLVEGLESLLAKSLLYRLDAADGEARFFMLETIREFAQERLAGRSEAALIQSRHAAFYVALAESIAPRLTSAQLSESLELLTRELDNLRAACAWSVTQAVAEAALRIAGCLQLFWYWRGHVEEGRRWLEAGLARSQGVSGPVQAKAYRSAGLLAWAQGDYAQAIAYDNRSLALYQTLGDKRGMAEALNSLGNSSSEVGDDDTARRFYEQSLTFYRASGYVPGIAMVLSNLGEVSARNDQYQAAWNYYNESVALKRRLGNPGSIAVVLLNLGEIAVAQGEDEQAVSYLEEGLRLGRKVNTPHIIGLCLENLAKLALRRGELAAAMHFAREALNLLGDIHNTRALVYTLEVTAGVFGFGGQPDIAVRLFGAADALRSALRVPLPPGDRAIYEWLCSGVKEARETQMWQTEWGMGQAMTLEETLDFALARSYEIFPEL